MKRYVVGLVFDSTLDELLFLKRNKEPFKDCINGPGGKIENDESIHDAMLREMQEETDIIRMDINKIEFMFTIFYPEGIELNAFYIVLNKDYIKKDIIETREGKLIWINYIKGNLFDASLENVAGEGNVAYFIKYALNREGK